VLHPPPFAAAAAANAPPPPRLPPQKQPFLSSQEVSGTVFTFDEATDCLVIKEPGTHGGVHNVRVLRASAVRSVADVKPPPQPSSSSSAAADAARSSPSEALARSVLGPLPCVDLARAKEREARALRQAQADLAKVGVGVTREAQALFDALAKTMPCEWVAAAAAASAGARGAGAAAAAAAAGQQQQQQQRHTGEIAVLDCVVIRPPYGPADCAALPGAEAQAAAAAGALERVKKVLKAARERLGLENA
jgi:hypothetical protein